jgi:hypothetical protein
MDLGLLGTVLGGFATAVSSTLAVRSLWTQRVIIRHRFAEIHALHSGATELQPAFGKKQDFLLLTVINRLDHAIKATGWGMNPLHGKGAWIPSNKFAQLPAKIERDDFLSIAFPCEDLRHMFGSVAFRAYVQFADGRDRYTSLIQDLGPEVKS